MTKLMEQAIDALHNIPAQEQDALARRIIDMASSLPMVLSTEERLAVEAGLADLDAGRIADDAWIEKRFGGLRTA